MILESLITFAVLLDAQAPASTTASSKQEARIAIVAALQGQAHALARERRSLSLFDWLNTGSRVEVAPESNLTLAFWNGVRYELGAGARARIGSGRLEDVRGSVKRLRSLPALPIVSPIREEDQPGIRSSALRIRSGGEIQGLYPHAGCVALADDVVLWFAGTDAAHRFHVQVEDENGRVVFERRAPEPPVRVPQGVLAPGRRYHWRVRGQVDIGPTLSGEAALVTLSKDVALRRARLIQAMGADVASATLLAGMDLGLGLCMEARDRLNVALASSPDDVGLRRALDDVETRLEVGKTATDASPAP
jgi:hypothetical protein